MNCCFVKLLIYSVLVSGLMACSSGLDKKYNPASREKDYQEIEKLISAEDFKLLKGYIQKRETEIEDISDYTYGVLLSCAQERERIRLEGERRRAEEEKQKAAEKVIIQQKTELLCSRKWKIENVEHVVGRAVMSLTDAAVKALNGNGKRWKIYLSDGTYKDEIFSRKGTAKGTWEFISPDIIRETRPTDSKSIQKNNVYVLTIKALDENQFRYTEVAKANHSAYGTAIRTTTKLVTMAAGD